MSASSSPSRAKKVSSKWGMVKIGKKGKKLRNIKKVMFVLHISANGNLSLEFEELNTGVFKIPGKSGKEAVRECPSGGACGGTNGFPHLRLKIRILRPRRSQHCERRVFKFPDNRTKIRASVDKRSKSAPLLHEDEESNGPNVTLDSALKWLGGPLGPQGKQYVVIAL